MPSQILSRRTALLALAATALLAVPACKHPNRDYCAGQPRNECPDDAIDAMIDMMPDARVCNDADCADSGVCLPDGTCAAVADVAYVQNGGSGTVCSKEAPCDHLSRGLQTTRRYIKVSGSIIEAPTLPVKITRDVTIVGDDSADIKPLSSLTADDLISIGDGANVEFRNVGLSFTKASPGTDPFSAISIEGSNASVTLVGARIHDNADFSIAMQAGADSASLTIIDSVIRGNGGGIWAEGDTGTQQKHITVTRSTFEDQDGTAIFINTRLLALSVSRSRIIDNGDGLVIARGAFQIVGNIIAHNAGGPASAGGGVVIGAETDLGGRFDFNTVALNDTLDDEIASGITCGKAVTLRGNIVFHNGAAPVDDILGPCTMDHTRTSADPDPMFTSDFHLLPQSLARRVVPDGWTVDDLSRLDIDGELRTSPADQGADQVQ